MAISQDWKAEAISGVAGFELIVTGQANTGTLDIVPELHKREPQGINPAILLLDLINARDAKPEHFQSVHYNERLNELNQYQSVMIYHDNNEIEIITVETDRS